MQKTKKSTNSWLYMGIFYILFMAPHPMIVKYAIEGTDMFFWNMLRFAIASLILLPLIILGWSSVWKKGVRKWTLFMIVSTTVALLTFTAMIKFSQASYTSIMNLLSPIILVLLSIIFTKDKISKQAITGITIAGFGASIIAVLPMLQNGSAIYPLATILGLINGVAHSISIISMRKMNEHKIPFKYISGMISLACLFSFGGLFLLFGEKNASSISTPLLLMAIYSGLGVSILGRIMASHLYEKAGAATIGVINYVATILAIILPILIMGENLTTNMIIGGLLILAGVYFIESHHKRKPKKHHFRVRHIWHHHQ